MLHSSTNDFEEDVGMIVYSKKLMQFINEIKNTVRGILIREVGLRVTVDRFYDRMQRSSYPIHVVIFNDTNQLGYFDAGFYELGFHECLMHSRREQLHNIIRHELAHYMTFINFGMPFTPHSAEFRATCQLLGWGEEVQCAATSVDSKGQDAFEEESSILRKVKKLLALASSSNVHEAEAAMLKSQQLLLKHHMETPSIDDADDERIVLKRILKQKRMNAKVDAIANILATFFVSIVYSRDNEYSYLEILGEPVNVSIAEYVAAVLDHQLDILWDQVQKSSQVRGTVAKNSFFNGVARGYCEKVQALKRTASADMTNALMVIEKKLDDAKEMVYPHLGTTRRSSLYCHEASVLGEKAGRQLNINPAVERSSERGKTLRLQFQK